MKLFFGQNLKTELSQKLVMNQEMIQSLEILQLSSGQLYDHVYDMMLENPVIDIEVPEQQVHHLMESSDFSEEQSGDLSSDNKEIDWYEYSQRIGSDDLDYYGRYTYGSENMERFEYSMTKEMTLEENLLHQIEFVNVSYLIKSIAAYIVQTLDDNGYMTCSLEEIAQQLNISATMAKEALELIWTFDPPGVGARNLSECLKIQLQIIGRLDEKLADIVDNHLEDIAMNRLEKVARAEGISIMEAIDYGELLKSLDPKPGRIFAPVENTKYIIPDVIVEENNGILSVRLKSSSAPKVIIRDEYRKMLGEADENSNVASFLTGRFDSAMWLIRCIEQRNSTIINVAEAIVKRQKRFMLSGRRYLVPITMKEIAEELEIHESTVSRAVNGKYMQCPQGTIEMRQLFVGSSKLKNRDGSYASSEALKTMIKTMVDLEDIRKPLSDKSIADAISVSGIEISRRTVAKYRDEMGIPSSSVRRRKIF